MKNSTIIILSIIATAVLYNTINNADVTTVIYISTLLSCTIYGIVRKNVNLCHIAAIIITIYIIEFCIFHLVIPIFDSPKYNKEFIFYLAFGAQAIVGILSWIIFIFRVQVSRFFSNSTSLALTEFDGVMVWAFIYISTISSLTLLNSFLIFSFDVSFLNFFYNYYERFMYIGMSIILGVLFSMVICTEKELKKVKTNE